MKICDNSSKRIKNAVKMCLAISFMLAYFIKQDYNHFYDYAFPIIFFVLIVRYFAIED